MVDITPDQMSTSASILAPVAAGGVEASLVPEGGGTEECLEGGGFHGKESRKDQQTNRGGPGADTMGTYIGVP